MKSDFDLQCFIEQQLLWTPSLDARNLKVRVKGRVASLKGSVRSLSEKALARTVAQQVPDCKAVVMDVMVRPISTLQADDSALAKAILTALAWQNELPRDAIRAVVDRGCVKLIGEVRDAAQSMLAESVVSRMRGVLQIVNQIRVSSQSQDVKAIRRIEEVGARIAEALSDGAKDGANGVHVDERDGVIRLTGKAGSVLEKQMSEQAAWSADGVRWVISQLEVL